MFKKISLILAVSALCSSVFASPLSLVTTPIESQRYVDVSPSVDRSASVYGVTAGDMLNASAGKKLIGFSVSTKITTPTIIAVADTTFSNGSANLMVKAGEKIQTEARFQDNAGKYYYLVKADPKISHGLSQYRYFAITEDGNVLDRAFSSRTDTEYQAREVITASGQLSVDKSVTVGPNLCKQSTTFLGASEDVAKFRVIRFDASGEMIAQKERAFTTDLKTISLPGTTLAVERVDPKSIRVRVQKVSVVNCKATL